MGVVKASVGDGKAQASPSLLKVRVVKASVGDSKKGPMQAWSNIADELGQSPMQAWSNLADELGQNHHLRKTPPVVRYPETP